MPKKTPHTFEEAVDVLNLTKGKIGYRSDLTHKGKTFSMRVHKEKHWFGSDRTDAVVVSFWWPYLSSLSYDSLKKIRTKLCYKLRLLDAQKILDKQNQYFHIFKCAVDDDEERDVLRRKISKMIRQDRTRLLDEFEDDRFYKSKYHRGPVTARASVMDENVVYSVEARFSDLTADQVNMFSKMVEGFEAFITKKGGAQ